MTPQQRIVLLVAIIATFVSGFDGFIVTVALPAIAHELGGGLTTQQWIVNASMLTLGSCILLAGSLSDLFGRKKILMIGLIGFSLASLLCAIAPNRELLIAARAILGIAGALLVPGSLALIMSHFSGKEEGKAIGTWTAWTVVAPAIAPFVSGILIDATSWRWVFALNLIPVIIGISLLRRLPETPLPAHHPRIDYLGALLCAGGLGAITFAFIEQPQLGWSHPLLYILLGGGLLLLTAFVLYERRSSHPMLPLGLFKTSNFTVGNGTTFAVYGGLALAIFTLTIFLQEVGHYSALAAGLATVPITIMMFVFSPLFGRLASKYGPRLFMGFGPIIIALGFLSMLLVDASVNYWLHILPGILLFGLGLSVTVAPLTTAILGSIDKAQSGIGSAINNAVSRIAGLIAIASIGLLLGTELSVEWFHRGVLVIALLIGTGGVISLIGIRNHHINSSPKEPAPLQ